MIEWVITNAVLTVQSHLLFLKGFDDEDIMDVIKERDGDIAHHGGHENMHQTGFAQLWPVNTRALLPCFNTSLPLRLCSMQMLPLFVHCELFDDPISRCMIGIQKAVHAGFRQSDPAHHACVRHGWRRGNGAARLCGSRKARHERQGRRAAAVQDKLPARPARAHPAAAARAG